MWLMDALIEDGRLDEAEEWCEKMAKIDHTFRTSDYRARIAWQRGDHDAAMAIWEQMCRDFPDDWMTWSSFGDGLTRAGKYRKAIECHEESKRHQKVPKFTDPQEAVSQLYERLGDIPAAIASLEEELDVLRNDWHITDGETVDAVKREIERLRRKL